jgi:hypothetical protein
MADHGDWLALCRDTFDDLLRRLDMAYSCRIDLAAGQQHRIEILRIGFIEGQVHRKLVGWLVMIHALHHAALVGNNLGNRTLAFQRVLGLRQFNLLEAIGNEDGDMQPVECRIHVLLLLLK